MTNRLKLFTESVSQMGIGTEEAAALTKLFKVCLESALGVYDYDEENPDYYDGDTTDLDIKEYGVNTKDDAREDIDVNERFNLYSHPEINDEMNEYGPDEENTETTVESTTGTSLVDAYIKVAPKLLASNQCSPKDIDNLGKFIDWLVNKFNSFDSKQYMKQAEDLTKAGKDYDADRMDKCLNVIDKGTPVVQLLRDIKAEFGTDLEQATITNESSLFAAAKDINNFVAKMFAGLAKGANIDNQRDTNVVTYDKGFYNTDDDSHEPSRDELNMAAEASRMKANNTKSESSPDKFPADTDVKDVDKVLTDFVSFIPSSNMSDLDAADFNKPVDTEKRNRAKKVANQRAEYTKTHKGDVIETSSLSSGDNPWDDL